MPGQIFSDSFIPDGSVIETAVITCQSQISLSASGMNDTVIAKIQNTVGTVDLRLDIALSFQYSFDFISSEFFDVLITLILHCLYLLPLFTRQ